MADDTKKKCDRSIDEHEGFHDTGKTGVNKLTGNTWRERACQCGAKRFNYFPHLAK